MEAKTFDPANEGKIAVKYIRFRLGGLPMVLQVVLAATDIKKSAVIYLDDQKRANPVDLEKGSNNG